MFRSMSASLFFFCCFLFSNQSIQNVCAETQPLTSNTEESNPKPSLKIIDQAKQYRVDTTLPWNKEKKREIEVLEQVCDHLEIFKAHSLKEGIEKFLNHFLDETESYEIVNARTTEFYGKSSGEVFFIKNAQGNLCYVVKAFPDSRTLQSHFLPEISAIDMLKDLKLKNFIPIEQCGMAICIVKGDEWGLLLETAAQGIRLDQYLRNISTENKESAKRYDRLEIALKAFKRVGSCLAGLHSKRALTPSLIQKNLIKKCDDKLAQILDNPFIIEKLSKHVDMNEFEKYVKEVKRKALSVTVYYNYIHGDTHMGNIFYDLPTDSCSFIDLGGLHRSVDVNGEPISHATMDLTQFDDSLGFYSTRLTEKEISLLREAFYVGYQEAGGQIPDSQLIEFYTLYFKLRRLVTKCEYGKETNPKIHDFDKAIFKEAVCYFQQHCQKRTPLQASKAFNELILKSVIRYCERVPIYTETHSKFGFLALRKPRD